MNIEDQIKLHKEISQKIEELEEQRKALGVEIMRKMPSKIFHIPGFIVRCCSRLSIKLSLDSARSLNAIKLEETVDKEKLKALYYSGQAIEGIREIQYIQISSKE